MVNYIIIDKNNRYKIFIDIFYRYCMVQKVGGLSEERETESQRSMSSGKEKRNRSISDLIIVSITRGLLLLSTNIKYNIFTFLLKIVEIFPIISEQHSKSCLSIGSANTYQKPRYLSSNFLIKHCVITEERCRVL